MSSAPAAPWTTLPNGTTIPQIGFGTLAVQPSRDASDENADITGEIVRAALKAGYRHLDSAQSYGTERGVGKAIAESGIPRDELYVASKLANPNHAPDDVRRSFDQTLEHLGLDRLDLFLIHWPLPTMHDGDYVSTWKAVAALVDGGRLRSAGVSNFLPEHLDTIIDETGLVPVVNQFELHPYFANKPTTEACAKYGIAVEAHSPLGHNREPLTDPTITEIAESLGRSTAQVILRWHVQRGDVSIPKSSRPERMVENLSVFDFELDQAQMDAINALDRGEDGRVGPHPNTWEG
ncbi:aldo/keto reductase [Aestuariimicrobium ganziense]|uniref:aldo/keto reductase n=1 Tax=Aestuariimicrobium ganziense TaxID=2773677 RepID=UPI00194248C0|nr:aldo/keto reductase [Aestuariimicrobium ganziense]